MGDPTKHLPDYSIDDIANELSSISFPQPRDIIPLIVGAGFHRIYRLDYHSEDYRKIVQDSGLAAILPSNGPDTSLILRVSGPHMPRIKTNNEVGILTYLTRHVSTPVPRIIHYENRTQNYLRNEYMIMSMLTGHTGADIYSSLSRSQLSHILDQLVDISLDIYKLDFDYIGGLTTGLDTRSTQYPQKLLDISLSRGPPMLETMWFAPDIDEHFTRSKSLTAQSPTSEMSVTTLNAVSPFGYPTYTAWLADQLRVYMYAIQIHSSLDWVLESDPSLTCLRRFETMLETDTALQSRLNDVPLKLAHRDLHFGNILLSPMTSPSQGSATIEPSTEVQYTVSGILDWEFAAVLPVPLWRHSFLWDGIRSPPATFVGSDAEFAAESRRTREQLYDEWCKKVEGRGGHMGNKMLRDARWKCPEQQRAWNVVNYLRCVVEVCPRGVRADDARRWWEEIVKALREFGIRVGEEL